MNSVYTIVSGGPPYQVGPYAGPSRGVFYELRVARSDVVSLSLSRRYAASESAKKAVARGSWFVKAHHHSEWAVVKYHSGPLFGTAPTNHKLIPHEPRATNYEQQKKHWKIPVLFLQESAASYPPRRPPPKYFRRLRA